MAYYSKEAGKKAAANAVRVSQEKRLNGTMKLYQVDPSTCDVEYTADEIEFMFAMHEYRRANHRPFPTWSEALRVLLALGYAKAAQR